MHYLFKFRFCNKKARNKRPHITDMKSSKYAEYESSLLLKKKKKSSHEVQNH